MVTELTCRERSQKVIAANSTGDANGKQDERKILGNIRFAIDKSPAMRILHYMCECKT
jgi:hypothetical protein